MKPSELVKDDRHARLLDAMPAIAWSASADTFRFNYISPAAEQILGYPAQRWLDEPTFWLEHLHPDDRHVAMLCHTETIACRNHELVYRMITADGREVWLRDYVNVHTVNGAAVELFGVMVDITREQQAEAASRESRENFRRMVELSPDCIGVHDGGRWMYVNQAFIDLLGATGADEIVGRELLSVIAPDCHGNVSSRLEELRAGNAVPYLRQKFVRVDGSLIDVESAALPMRYGNREAVQVIARDITDRVRAEEELQIREMRLQLLASGTHEAIWEWSPERNELWTNAAYLQLVGAPNDPAAFLDEWLSRVHPGDRDDAQRMKRAAVEQDPPATWWLEYRLRQPGGTYRVVLDRGHSVRSSSGERRVIGAMLDITESVRAQNALEEAKRMSSLGQLAASLAHEFNNVLMGIQPFVEVIARNAPASGVSEAIGHITRAISRGKRASHEILRFANPKEPNVFSIDIRTWLPTLLGQLQATLPSTITLVPSISDDVRFMLGDSGQLEQVITNLVFNARDAIGGNDGFIHVAVSGDERFISISVTDDGPGIPQHVLDRIFEPLFTTKRNGTGLGLAIARRLMERQGGALSVENRPEGGAAFHVLIPAAQGESPVSAMPAAAPALHVRRILLVEDDASVGSGIQSLLQSEGYETTWVRNAADVPAAARRSRPEVAIIDVNLPDGSGVDLVPLLRERHAGLPIVLSTGHVELNLSSDKERILSLMKPYELGDLLNAIANVTAAA
jgi:PAS domain S-box-containing protein